MELLCWQDGEDPLLVELLALSIPVEEDERSGGSQAV